MKLVANMPVAQGMVNAYIVFLRHALTGNPAQAPYPDVRAFLGSALSEIRQLRRLRTTLQIPRELFVYSSDVTDVEEGLDAIESRLSISLSSEEAPRYAPAIALTYDAVFGLNLAGSGIWGLQESEAPILTRLLRDYGENATAFSLAFQFSNLGQNVTEAGTRMFTDKQALREEIAIIARAVASAPASFVSVGPEGVSISELVAILGLPISRLAASDKPSRFDGLLEFWDPLNTWNHDADFHLRMYLENWEPWTFATFSVTQLIPLLREVLRRLERLERILLGAVPSVFNDQNRQAREAFLFTMYHELKPERAAELAGVALTAPDFSARLSSLTTAEMRAQYERSSVEAPDLKTRWIRYIESRIQRDHDYKKQFSALEALSPETRSEFLGHAYDYFANHPEEARR